MSFAVRAALAAATLVTVAAPAADARVAADAAAAKPKSFGVKSLSAQRSVRAGSTFRVRGSVTKLRRCPHRPAHLQPAPHPAGAQLAAARPRDVARPPDPVDPHPALHQAARRAGQRARGALPAARLRAPRQRPRRLPLARPAGDPPRAEPDHAHAAHPGPRPRHATDRRAGGAAEPARTAHRRELLLRDGRPLRERRPRRTTSADCPPTGSQSGFDPDHKGFYHGGDLKGLLDRVDYIKGLGTTAIWLTPSFKNKPVQGPSGSDDRRLPRLLDHRLHPDRPAPRDQRGPRRSRRGRARPRDEGLLRHHHQPHRGRHHLRAEVRRPGPVRLRPEGRRPLPDRGRRPVRRPRLRGHRRLPRARRGDELPVHAGEPGRQRGPRQRQPQGPRVAQRRHALPQPRRTRRSSARTPCTATSSASTTCSPRISAWSTG